MKVSKAISFGNDRKVNKYKVTIEDKKSKPKTSRCITINDGFGIRPAYFMKVIMNGLKEIKSDCIESRYPKKYEFSYRFIIEKMVIERKDGKSLSVRDDYDYFNIITEEKLNMDNLMEEVNKKLLKMLSKLSVKG